MRSWRPFPQQVFDHLDNRALAQVIRVFFKGQAEDANACGIQIEDGANEPRCRC